MKSFLVVSVLLLALVSASSEDSLININFNEMFSGSNLRVPSSSPTPAPTSAPTTAPTSAPSSGNAYKALGYAFDAAHARVAEKGLWTKIFVSDNDQWPSINYDAGCEPAGAKFPFPPKTGAFADLLNRGLRVSYATGAYAFSNGKTYPPTGIEVNYLNALYAEMQANYSSFPLVWVPYANNSDFTQKVKSRAFDVTLPLPLNGYLERNVFTNSNRARNFLQGSCNSYVMPSYTIALSSSPYRSYTDLVAAGANLKVGAINPSLAYLPNATITIVPENTDFLEIMRLVANRTIDIYWDAIVVATDVAGTNFTLNQFVNIPSGVTQARFYAVMTDY